MHRASRTGDDIKERTPGATGLLPVHTLGLLVWDSDFLYAGIKATTIIALGSFLRAGVVAAAEAEQELRPRHLEQPN